MEKDYGDLKFDMVKFAEKLDAIVQESKTIPLYDRITDQIKNMPSVILESDIQKAHIYKTTDVIIYIVTKYIMNSTLPKILEAMDKDNVKLAHTVETYKKIAEELLNKESTVQAIESHVNVFLTKSKEYMEKNPGEQVDIDKLYDLPSGSMVNVALECFSTTSHDPESYTHLVLLDDVYGYSAIVPLDPKNLIKPTKEETNVD